MAGPDHLLLIYRPKKDPDGDGNGEVRDIMRVRSPVQRVRATWRKWLDWMGSIQRVATLSEPLKFDDLITAGMNSQQFQGRPNVIGSRSHTTGARRLSGGVRR